MSKAVAATEDLSASIARMGTATILTAWLSLLPLILVTSPTSNGTSLAPSCPSCRAERTVEGARGGRTVPCSMASCGS